MTLNELFAIQEADVTKEFLLKAGWSEIAEEPGGDIPAEQAGS